MERGNVDERSQTMESMSPADILIVEDSPTQAKLKGTLDRVISRFK